MEFSYSLNLERPGTQRLTFLIQKLPYLHMLIIEFDDEWANGDWDKLTLEDDEVSKDG